MSYLKNIILNGLKLVSSKTLVFIAVLCVMAIFAGIQKENDLLQRFVKEQQNDLILSQEQRKILIAQLEEEKNATREYIEYNQKQERQFKRLQKMLKVALQNETCNRNALPYEVAHELHQQSKRGD